MRPKIFILFMMIMPPFVLLSLLFLPGPRTQKIILGMLISLVFTHMFALAFPPGSKPLKDSNGYFEGEEVIYESSANLRKSSALEEGRLLLTNSKIAFRPASASGFQSEGSLDIPVDTIKAIETSTCPDGKNNFQQVFESLLSPAPLSIVTRDDIRLCFIVKNRFSWVDKINSVISHRA